VVDRASGDVGSTDWVVHIEMSDEWF